METHQQYFRLLVEIELNDKIVYIAFVQYMMYGLVYATYWQLIGSNKNVYLFVIYRKNYFGHFAAHLYDASRKLVKKLDCLLWSF